MLFQLQALPALFTQFLQILCTVLHIRRPLAHPFGIPFHRSRCAMILAVIFMIAIVIPLHRRWMRAARFADDRAYLETWRKHAIGIADDDLMRDNFFRDDDDALTCERGLFADAQVSPRMRIPRLVRALVAPRAILSPRPRAHVAAPCRDPFPDATPADQLVEEDVGNGADQGQIAHLPANDFVPRGKWDQRP